MAKLKVCLLSKHELGWHIAYDTTREMLFGSKEIDIFRLAWHFYIMKAETCSNNVKFKLDILTSFEKPATKHLHWENIFKFVIFIKFKWIIYFCNIGHTLEIFFLLVFIHRIKYAIYCRIRNDIMTYLIKLR